jgi:intracellular multiplication protein IcmN
VSVTRERALTLARSRVVGEYLWSQGVDSRFIFTQGLGSDKPIMRFTQGGDFSLNSRIEITFRDSVA